MQLGSKFEKAKWRAGVVKGAARTVLSVIGAYIVETDGIHVERALARASQRKAKRQANKPF